jgi:hypothetical protein
MTFRKSSFALLFTGSAILLGALAAAAIARTTEPQDKWISMFNGKNLDGWTPKVVGSEYGVDDKNIFTVKDGVIHVSYDGYDKFEGQFGHLFYKAPYSHYKMRLEYRFYGDQLEGGPGWAFRNSGIMVHGQNPKTMTLDQSFPVSIEVQLLGGGGSGKRTTGNLCTPGTHVVMDGELKKQHCFNSTSDTFHGDGWVKAEIEVRGNEIIRHFIDGKEVLVYTNPQLDDGDADAKPLIKDGQLMLSGGSISLQAESHGCEFRNIEILPLK